MTDNKHTPGPWTLESGPTSCFHEGNELAIVKHEQEAGETVTSTIAEVWPSGEPGVAEADARLIAAAPQMLAALQRCERAFEQGRYPELQGVVSDVFQAVRAATVGDA